MSMILLEQFDNIINWLIVISPKLIFYSIYIVLLYFECPLSTSNPASSCVISGDVFRLFSGKSFRFPPPRTLQGVCN